MQQFIPFRLNKHRGVNKMCVAMIFAVFVFTLLFSISKIVIRTIFVDEVCCWGSDVCKQTIVMAASRVTGFNKG